MIDSEGNGGGNGGGERRAGRVGREPRERAFLVVDGRVFGFMGVEDRDPFGKKGGQEEGEQGRDADPPTA